MSARLDNGQPSVLEQSGHGGTVVLVLIVLACVLAMVGSL